MCSREKNYMIDSPSDPGRATLSLLSYKTVQMALIKCYMCLITFFNYGPNIWELGYLITDELIICLNCDIIKLLNVLRPGIYEAWSSWKLELKMAISLSLAD